MSKVESDPTGRYVIVVGHLYGFPIVLGIYMVQIGMIPPSLITFYHNYLM